jgi:hypothetical protein
MDGEARIILAFLYKRSGKSLLSAPELYLPLSMELRWFSAKEAQEFISEAINEKLLIESAAGLSLAFDLATVAIPSGFVPSRRPVVRGPPPNASSERILNAMLRTISERSARNLREVTTDVEKVAASARITPEVAALVVGRRLGLDVSAFFDAVERTVVP